MSSGPALQVATTRGTLDDHIGADDGPTVTVVPTTWSTGPRATVAAILVAVATVSCGGTESPESGSSENSGATVSAQLGAEEPEVVEVAATPTADGTYRFDVTISSPYDRPEKYADAWRVVGPDGTVLGTRELTHPHTDEQPFTRSLSGVEIPDDVATVTIEARDLVDGWTATPVEVELER